MSVSDPRHCPECGSDTYFAQNFERVRDKLTAVSDAMRQQAARHAVEKANWELKELDRKSEIASAQRKAHVQRLVINRLEKKLRGLGKQPHESDDSVVRWKCGSTGHVWEGDISNHHGIKSGEGYCGGPHLRTEDPLDSVEPGEAT